MVLALSLQKVRTGSEMRSFWRRYGILLLCLAGIAAVSAIGLALRGRWCDVALFRAVNAGLASPALDVASYAGYVLGSFWFSLGLFAALWLAGYRRFALSALGASIAGGLLVLLIKYLSQQPRPWQVLAGVRIVGLRAWTPGFPSGHAEQAFLTSYLLIHYFRFRWYLQVALYSAAALIGLSRIYVGNHLPTDVVAGAAIGLLLGALWVRSRFWPPAAGAAQEGQP